MESSTKGSYKKIPDSAIQHSLYGYKEMRLVSSEEVLSTLLRGKMSDILKQIPISDENSLSLIIYYNLML